MILGIPVEDLQISSTAFPVNRGLLIPDPCIVQIGIDVHLGLRQIQMRKNAGNIDSLPDCGIPLITQLLVPEFILADQNQGHLALRIKGGVQQEPELFQRFLFQQMGFIKNADDFPVFLGTDDFNLLLQ